MASATHGSRIIRIIPTFIFAPLYCDVRLIWCPSSMKICSQPNYQSFLPAWEDSLFYLTPKLELAALLQTSRSSPVLPVLPVLCTRPTFSMSAAAQRELKNKRVWWLLSICDSRSVVLTAYFHLALMKQLHSPCTDAVLQLTQETSVARTQFALKWVAWN